MTRDLHEKLGSVGFEKLFAGLQPAAIVKGGTIAKGTEETTYARGTLLEKGSDGKLYLMGTDSGNSADCVLTDEVTVGTTDDENVTVYVTGCFNEEALIMAPEYSLTEADRDTLRMKGILLGTVQEP